MTAVVVLMLTAPLAAAQQPASGQAEEGAPAAGRIRILIDNVAGDLGPAWPMYCGVPFPRGSLRDARQVRVVDADGKVVPSQARRLANWAGTDEIRWLAVDFSGDPARQYFVEFGPAIAPSDASTLNALLRREGDRLVIETGPAKFVVPSSGPLVAEGYLDLNGDGAFAADELVVNNADGDDLYLVDNQGRQGTIGRDAEPNQLRAEPEEDSPLHACVRREGWYVAEDAEKLARHITRLHFYRGKPFVRIQHTLVLTSDTDRLWFRDMGVRFRHRMADAQTVSFDSSHDFDGAVFTTRIQPDDRSAYMFQEKAFYMSRMDPGKDCRFTIGKVRADGKEQVLQAGQRCGEWADVSGSRAGVTLAVRHLWQQYPKELEVAPGEVIAHLWSHRGGREFDLRLETLRKLWPEDWLNTTYHKEADLERLKRANTQGLGMAKSHELLLYLHKGDAATAQVPQIGHVLEKPVLCLADPAWLYRSLAMGPIYPYDPQHFPKIEAWYETCFDLAERTRLSWGDYGFLAFGSGPHCWYRVASDGPLKGRVIPYLDRYSHADYGYHAQVWVPYVRSGKRKFYEAAEEINQERMDIEMVHWDDPQATLERYTNALHGKFQGGFCLGGIVSPLPWTTATYLHRQSGSDVRHLPYCYYLCDNRRAWDVFQEYRALVKKVWRPDPGDTADHAPYDYTHRVGGALRCLAVVYQETGDEEVLALGKDWVSKLVALKQPHGMDFDKFEKIGHAKWEVKAHALARWYEATGDELAAQAILRISQTHANISMGQYPNSYYTAWGYYLGTAYRLHGDPAYARVIGRNLDLAVHSYEDTLQKAGQKKLRTDALGLAATGVGMHNPGQPSINSGGLQDLPFALDVLSLYTKRTGQPVPATPIIQQTTHGPATTALFHKPADQETVLEVRSWYPFFPQVKTVSGAPVEKVAAEGFAGTLGYVMEPRYQNAPNSYRITVPADLPAGTYVLDPGLAGAPWEVTWTNAPKIVLYAPRGLMIGVAGQGNWPAGYQPGGAIPARQADWCFVVPQGVKELELFLGRPCQLLMPDGRPVQAVEGKAGALRVAVASEQAGKLWQIVAAEPAFVELRGVPPLFTYDPERFFTPDLSIVRETSGVSFQLAMPLSTASWKLTPRRQGTYVSGVSEGLTSDRALLLVGSRALQLERGPELDPHRFERFDCRAGTLEFWIRPNWTSGYVTDRLRLLAAGGWNVQIRPFTMHFSVESGTYQPGMWSATKQLASHVGAAFEAGRWTHLAYQWYWQGKKFFLEIYVNGRLQNIGSALVRQEEKDCLDAEYVQNFPGTVFDTQDIAERFTLGPGIDAAIDNVRISDVRRYEADFVPSRSESFKPDAHTLALFHLDGTTDGVSGQGQIIHAALTQ